MNDQKPFLTARESIDKANSLLVLLPPEPTDDLVISALSLHLSLLNSGKKSQIGCASEIHQNPKITGYEHFRDTVGSRNLLISFDFNESDLDKIDYDIKNDGKFVLMVKPKPGSPVPDVSGVKFSYSGAEADLVVVLGINSLEELGKLYADEKEFLDSAEILSINTSPRPSSSRGSNLHLLYPSFAELVTTLLEGSNLSVSTEAAANLLNGIYESTQNLTSSKLSADTFSNLAFLMRQGARLPNQQASIPRFRQPQFFDSPSDSSVSEDQDQAIPADWKKPKIFRANETPFMR